MRHPLNCSPPHQSMSCCNLLWRLAPVKKNKSDQQKQEPCLLSVIDDIHTARSPFWTDDTSVAYVLKTTPSLKSAGKPNTLQNKIMSIVLDLFQNSSWSIIIVKEMKEYCFYREEMCDAMLPWKQNFWISKNNLPWQRRMATYCQMMEGKYQPPFHS